MLFLVLPPAEKAVEDDVAVQDVAPAVPELSHNGCDVLQISLIKMVGTA